MYISRSVINQASFQRSSEFSRTKFLLMIDHPQKLHTAKNFSYTVRCNILQYIDSNSDNLNTKLTKLN